MPFDLSDLGTKVSSSDNKTSSGFDLSDIGSPVKPVVAPTQEEVIQNSANLSDLTPAQKSRIDEINAARPSGAATIPGRTAAAVVGAGRGMVDTALDTANFVGEMLAKIPALKPIGTDIQELSYPIQDRTDIEKQYPGSADVGHGAGKLAGLIAGPKKIVAGAELGISKLMPQAAPLVSAAVSKISPSLPSIARIGAEGSVAGTINAGERNRAEGAIVGGLAAAGGTAVLSGIGKYFGANAAKESMIDDAIKTIKTSPDNLNKDIYTATNEAFDQFKSVPGKVLTVRPQKAVTSYVSQYGSRLSKNQSALLEELNQGLKDASNIEELHAVRKAFTKDFRKAFLVGDDALNGKARDMALELKTTVENNLQMNAAKLGVLDKYKQANDLFKQELDADLVSNYFTKSLQGDGSRNLNAFVANLRKAVEKGTKITPRTKQALDGVFAVMQDANNALGVHTSKLGVVQPLVNTATNLLNNTAGRLLFIKAGYKSPQARELAKQLAQGLLAKIPSDQLRVDSDQSKVDQGSVSSP